MYDVLTLISTTVTLDQYGREETTEKENTVYCRVDSISQNEFFNAADAQISPEFRFTVFFGDYNGEEVCKFNGVRYGIYRTFRRGDDLELYAERKIGA